MTPVVAVITRLRAMTPLTDLVGSRIVNQHYEQKPELPAVLVFEVDAIEGEQHLNGPGASFSVARIQTECRALRKPVADAVADAVHGDGLGEDASGLYGWIGSLGGSPSFQIVNVKHGGRRSGYDAEALRQYWVQNDYLVIYRGTV